MNWKDEFPEYKEEMKNISIPAEFDDVSWHNDASPCFENTKLKLRLWIDRVDPKKRVSDPQCQYLIFKYENEDDSNSEFLFESDNWSEILNFINNYKVSEN